MKKVITTERVVRRLGRELRSLKKSLRKTIARGVYSIPPLRQRDPRHRLITFDQYCTTVQSWPDSKTATGNWRLPISKPEEVTRELPECLNPSDAAKFHISSRRYQGGTTVQLSEAFLACIQNAKVYSQDFLILSRDNRIFFESALLQQNVLEKNGILETLLWPTVHKELPTACLLAQETPNAYYHWLIEVLPKISIIRRFPHLESIPLIVPPVLKSFQVDSLKRTAIADSRIIPFDNGCWKIGKLYFPSLLAPTGSPSPAAVAWLREQFLPNSQTNSSGPKRIYLTRRDASQRRVSNEHEIVKWLEAEGFVTVCPGELSFQQQIELFSNVEIVVAAHGAGATNMVFAPSTAMLIELFGDSYINGCFWALTNILGQRYGFLTGPAHWPDYSIDVNELKRLLSKMSETQLEKVEAPNF